MPTVDHVSSSPSIIHSRPLLHHPMLWNRNPPISLPFPSEFMLSLELDLIHNTASRRLMHRAVPILPTSSP